MHADAAVPASMMNDADASLSAVVGPRLCARPRPPRGAGVNPLSSNSARLHTPINAVTLVSQAPAAANPMSKTTPSPEHDAIRLTLQTYRRHAAHFAERYWRTRSNEALERFMERLPQGAHVLDLGCGPGRDLALLRRAGHSALGLDRVMSMLREAQARTEEPLLQADSRRLPFQQAAFDAVWANASLLHLPRDEMPPALQGIRRVLRTAGLFYLSLKAGDGIRWLDAPGPRAFTLYRMDDLLGLLQASGMRVLQAWEQVFQDVPWIHAIAARGH